MEKLVAMEEYEDFVDTGVLYQYCREASHVRASTS